LSRENSFRRPTIWLLGLALAAMAGCQSKNEYEAPPPPTVTVAQPVQQTVTNYIEETGTTEAVEKVEIRARVKGFLEQVKFEPGTVVKKGAPLYLIEQRQYLAKVAAAKATVAAREVELEKAKIEYNRQLKLREGDATAEMNVVAAKAEQDAGAAAVDEAKALLDEAQRELEYTEVVAPIDGRVGKTLVKAGNLVGDSEATHLTTVIKYDPIYVNFNISERAFLELSAKTPRGEDRNVKKESAKIYVRRAIDEGFPYAGNFDYADLTVDQTTGTFLVRGIFSNARQDIVPGLFVTVRLPIGKLVDALLIPEVAVSTDQRGKYLLVVNDKSEVERRDVTLGIKVGSMVVVEKGIEAGQQVIIDGVQRARQGAKVTAKKTTLAPPKSDTGAPQPEAAKEDSTAPPADTTDGETTDREN
jgi:RND family efflux transporter MFP subunit